MHYKKTKIVCTIGPATESKDMLLKLVHAGMDVMRLNFSHGDFGEHQQRVDNLRSLTKKITKPIAILQDLSGPKIRIGEFSKPTITLTKGKQFTLTTQKIVGDVSRVYVNYPTLPKEVTKGQVILLDDGKKKLVVQKTTKTDVVCTVVVGGETKPRRGVNIPGAYLKVKSLTAKDRKDLVFGIKNKVDFFALSFVRKASDIQELRKILQQKKSRAKIIAKIETQEAIDNIDAIIDTADGIMVARGDLAIEVPAEKVPVYQKQIIEKCRLLGKPVITATQMLESMIHSPVATRAEVSDVANAILDGTDAVMLSEETTLGKYPVEAVETMSRIAGEIEQNEQRRVKLPKSPTGRVTVDSVTAAVVKTARAVDAEAIIALTHSGFSARMTARHRPHVPVFAFTPDETVCRELALSFGCYGFHTKETHSFEKTFASVRSFCLRHEIAKKNDRVVLTGGLPFNTQAPSTNMLWIEKI